MSSILSIGHPTLDLFLPLKDAHLQDAGMNLEELCLPYPDKMRVDRLDMLPGGNAVNVAAGLKTLGQDAKLLVHQSDDIPGAVLSEYYEEVGIPVLGDMRKEETDVSVVLSYEGDRVILSHHAPASWDWIGLPAEVDWVYLSSIGTETFQPLHRELKADLMERPDVRCAYNPGTRELKHPAGELEILEVVDLLVVNRKEACTLLQQEVREASGAVMDDLTGELRQFGPDHVVITDGDQGAWGRSSEGLFYQPPFPTEVVESTGAGDAFSAGCVGAMMEGHELFEAVRWGSAMSHSVLQSIGATEGILNRKQMESVLSEHEDRRPERRSS